MLSAEQITTFKMIYFKYHGISLSDEQAGKLSRELIEFVKLVLDHKNSLQKIIE